MSSIVLHQQAPVIVPTISDDDNLIELWLSSKRRKSPCTQRAYQSDIATFREAVGKPIRAVGVVDLELYAVFLAARGLAPASQRRMIASVRSLLAYALKVGYCHVNAGAAVDMERPADTLHKRILSAADVTRLVALEPDATRRAILNLAFLLGARASELCSLRWGDVQENAAGNYVFHVTGKGGKVRHLEVERGKVRADLDALRARNTPTIVGVGTVQVWRYARAAASRAGLDRDANGDERHISPHWLRHACASVATARGATPAEVQAYLGHESLATTTRYVHLTRGANLSRYL